MVSRYTLPSCNRAAWFRIVRLGEQQDKTILNYILAGDWPTVAPGWFSALLLLKVRQCKTTMPSAASVTHKAGRLRVPGISTTQMRQAPGLLSSGSWQKVGMKIPACSAASKTVEPLGTVTGFPSIVRVMFDNCDFPPNTMIIASKYTFLIHAPQVEGCICRESN